MVLTEKSRSGSSVKNPMDGLEHISGACKYVVRPSRRLALHNSRKSGINPHRPFWPAKLLGYNPWFRTKVAFPAVVSKFLYKWLRIYLRDLEIRCAAFSWVSFAQLEKCRHPLNGSCFKNPINGLAVKPRPCSGEDTLSSRNLAKTLEKMDLKLQETL